MKRKRDGKAGPEAGDIHGLGGAQQVYRPGEGVGALVAQVGEVALLGIDHVRQDAAGVTAAHHFLGAAGR